MNRKEFLQRGCCALAAVTGLASAEEPAKPAVDPEKEFLRGWMTDLFQIMEAQLDQPTKVKLMLGTGQGCYRRHSFKHDVVKAGEGDVDKLIVAYKRMCEAWREGDLVHIRFGPEVKQCYCPAARFHPPVANDMHCECSRASNQTIFEKTLGRPIKVEIVESVRRGGKTCHFVAHVA